MLVFKRQDTTIGVVKIFPILSPSLDSADQGSQLEPFLPSFFCQCVAILEPWRSWTLVRFGLFFSSFFNV